MATKKKQPCKWYIEPRDINTNEALARELSGDETLEIHDDKGNSLQVYLIPSRKLSKFRNSKAQADFRFNVFVQEGGGKIRNANFLPAVRRNKKLQLPTKQTQAATVS